MVFQIIYSLLLMMTVFLITRIYYSKKIKELTIIDERTGIYSKTCFDTLYRSEFNRARRINHPLSIVFIKTEPSIEIAKKLAISIERDTDFIAQCEEGLYVAILNNTNSDGTDKVIDRIIRNMPVDISINIGVYAGIPDRHVNSENLLNEAKKALKKSIKQGKNCIEFSLNSI